MQREALPEIVHSYMTGKTTIPDYAKRIKVEIIVPDSAMKQIVDDISDSLSHHAGSAVISA
jgi:nitrogen regulatory protein PII